MRTSFRYDIISFTKFFPPIHRSPWGYVAKANADAAQAKLELEIFKSPRFISPNEGNLIVSKMVKFAKQGYFILTYWDMKEPLSFSKELQQVLNNAGWIFLQPKDTEGLMPGIEGIQVWVRPEAELKAKEAANVLVKELNNIGQATTLRLHTPINTIDDRILINVGTKPIK